MAAVAGVGQRLATLGVAGAGAWARAASGATNNKTVSVNTQCHD